MRCVRARVCVRLVYNIFFAWCVGFMFGSGSGSLGVIPFGRDAVVCLNKCRKSGRRDRLTMCVI